jgi:uncharacterized membrane protein YgdD (TMEM256/DUF423 family)
MIIRVAAWTGFSGVALGAFGAHVLEETLQANDRVDTWETAVFYHLVHALALLLVGLFPKAPKGVAYAFVIGVILFSGSLYLLSLTNITKLGMVVPLGGVSFLVGWAILAFKPPIETVR